MYKINLNCDLGEGAAYDEQIIPLINSANIACGFHAGNHDMMEATAKLCIDNNVDIGAHPGYPDKENFGRTNLDVTPKQVYDYTLAQLEALGNVVGSTGKIVHIKPHGAMYNQAAKNKELADAIVDAIIDYDKDLILMALSGSQMIKSAKEKKIRYASEVFADRAYEADGSLRARSLENSMITDEDFAVERVIKMVQTGKVVAYTGEEINIEAHSVCVHGDSEKALVFVKKLNEAFRKNNIETVSLIEAIKYDIRIPIFSYDDAVILSNEAVKQNKNMPYHFCIDTGMSRIGFQVNEESADICKRITELPNIFAEGMFSHFATSDEADLSKAIEQRNKYKQFCKMLSDRKIEIPIKHLNNSAGIMNFDEYFDMCRMGIVTYGLYPSEEVDKSLLDIEPIMSWYTKISHIKELEPKREISYGGTFITEKTTKVATIPIGYADAFPRCLSNKGKVIINGKYAKILGRVCMDQFMVDVSDIDCNINDEVVIVGTQNGAHISIEELSDSAYSFNYELPCRIPARVNRVYVYNDEVVEDVGLV